MRFLLRTECFCYGFGGVYALFISPYIRRKKAAKWYQHFLGVVMHLGSGIRTGPHGMNMYWTRNAHEIDWIRRPCYKNNAVDIYRIWNTLGIGVEQ